MDFYRWRPHPWHGLDAGRDAPEWVNVYVEITPFDSMKYEVDKVSGYLRVDRPQAGASLPPCSYGFIPRTLADHRVAALSREASRGDGDPLDVCVISELPINRAEILLTARVVGGFCMIDGGAADDKLIAVLGNDGVWGGVTDVKQLPPGMVARIRHYFHTYKTPAGQKISRVKLGGVYGARTARRLVAAAQEDYHEHFGESGSEPRRALKTASPQRKLTRKVGHG